MVEAEAMETSQAQTKVIFASKLPGISRFGSETILIYDRALRRRSSEIRDWINQFPTSYGVRGGEDVKAIERFDQHIRIIVHKTATFSRKQMKVVTLGGGSVTDFGGFVASIVKRGVTLIHVPSTWLAAIDAAHGGKTALNVGQAKNQVGTFYLPSRAYIVRSLLLAQPERRAKESLGELIKIALLDGGKWTQKLHETDAYTPEAMWSFLRPAIEAKQRVVEKDPLEKNGKRVELNFGHTLGHVLERHHNVPHGEAVLRGLWFSLRWSRKRGYLSQAEFQKIQRRYFKDSNAFLEPQMPRRKFLDLASKDKKSKGNGLISFVFLSGIGRAVVKPVKLEQFANEAAAQGWVKP